jgi:hypothetical protein
MMSVIEIRSRVKGLKHMSGLKKLLLYMVLFHVPPLVVYGCGRLSGSIPAEAEWFHETSNDSLAWISHGPWHGEIIGLVIQVAVLSQLLLFIGSLVVVPVVALDERNLKTLWKGLVLLGLQVALIWFMSETYFWTVD